MITFFLMGQKGLITLQYLIRNNYGLHISCIILSHDKNIKEDFYKEIYAECQQNNIACYDRNSNYKVTSDYSIAISWRWLIKLKSSQKLIVLHDSLLPRLRGFNPLVTALINGDSEIGVTALFAENEYDRGDVIDSEKITINYPIKIQQAIEAISDCYSIITSRILEKVINEIEIIGVTQNELNATYSLWRDTDDYLINWNDDSAKILRFINAVGKPYNGALSIIDGNSIIIDDAEEFPDVLIENRAVGKVIFINNEKPVIVCGKGLLKVKKAYNSSSLKSILPLKKFRTRF